MICTDHPRGHDVDRLSGILSKDCAAGVAVSVGSVQADCWSAAAPAGNVVVRARPAARDVLSSWSSGRFGVILDGIPAPPARDTAPDAAARKQRLRRRLERLIGVA